MNSKKRILKTIGIIILSISIILNGISVYYLSYTNNFLNSSFSGIRKNTDTYYIIAEKNSDYKNKNDINENIYYYKDSPNITSALNIIKKEIDITVTPYNDVVNMLYDVVNKKIDFIALDKTSYHTLIKLSNNLNQENFKIIYKFNIENKQKTSTKVRTAFNVYIRGIDTDGLSDYNAIATINTSTHEILLTSIPRDYYMEIYGTNGKKDSLSHMFIYPEGTSKSSLEDFFDISLDYTIDITPDGLVSLVDKLGGITYCSDQNFRIHIPTLNTLKNEKKGWFYIKKRCQELDGLETYGVAHERNSFVGRDRMRQKNCQKIIIAIFEKMKSANLISNYKEILDSLNNLYTTDIPKEVITNIAKDTIDGAEWKFITQSVDGSDKWDADIAILNDKGYAMIPNRDDVVKATNKINEVLSKK